jgi:predicted porin
MKKTLVLASLLAAFGAASAQSSVTVYGWVDASLNQTKATTYASSTAAAVGVAQTGLDSGNINGSRLGFRGTEALGNGLNAVFTIETGFGVDNAPATSLGNRQTFVGLNGGFGSLTAGRHYTAYDSARGAIDPTGHSAYSAVSAGGSAWGQGRSYQFRTNNSLRFDTANYSGFSAAATMSFGEDKTTTQSASTVTSLHAKYIAGPIVALAAMQTEKNSGSAYAATGQSAAGTDPAAGTKNTHTLVAGSYNFGIAKVTAGYNTSKNNAASTVADKEMQFGLNVPFGAASAVLSYATSKQSGVYKASGVAAELHYSLSPRTHTYVGLANGSKKTDMASGNYTSAKFSKFGVGVRHAF